MHHWLTGLAAERLLELWHVGNYTVDARKGRRMRIGGRLHPLILRALVGAGPLRHPNEEPLVRRKAIDVLQVLALGLLLPRNVGEQRSVEIGDVFAARQRGDDVEVVDD